MKTKGRKKLIVHNYPKCCANCDYYIYEDQKYMTIRASNNTQMWFHQDYTGCKDSEFLPIIHTNRSKEGNQLDNGS